jgi:hypothetical protein
MVVRCGYTINVIEWSINLFVSSTRVALIFSNLGENYISFLPTDFTLEWWCDAAAKGQLGRPFGDRGSFSLTHTRWENLGSSIAMEDILKDPKLCSSVGNLAAIRSFFQVKKDDGQER